jgi:hypothetical protein
LALHLSCLLACVAFGSGLVHRIGQVQILRRELAHELEVCVLCGSVPKRACHLRPHKSRVIGHVLAAHHSSLLEK